LHDNLIRLLLDLRLLLFDDIDEKLLFKTFCSDSEIDERDLDANFRLVVRI